jgi:hypothetical protein
MKEAQLLKMKSNQKNQKPLTLNYCKKALYQHWKLLKSLIFHGQIIWIQNQSLLMQMFRSHKTTSLLINLISLSNLIQRNLKVMMVKWKVQHLQLALSKMKWFNQKWMLISLKVMLLPKIKMNEIHLSLSSLWIFLKVRSLKAL